MKKKIFYAFLPLLQGKTGHIYTYHKAVEKAVQTLGWDYIALVPKKPSISLPQNWKESLPKDSWQKKKTKIEKMRLLYKHFLCLKKEIKKMAPSSLFFLEHFEVFHIAALLWALFFSRKKIKLWILHRYDLKGKKKLFYTLAHFFLRRKVGKNNFRLLTDSALLQKSQQQSFRMPVSLVPIPHGIVSPCSTVSLEKKSRFLWWPGGSLRRAKGLFEIQKLSLELTRKKTTFKLLLSEKGKKLLPTHTYSCCQFIKEELSAEEYASFLYQSSFLLLPYDPFVYKEGTSGIFVESITSGKIPLLKEGSWLAFEARKLNLKDLILDWKKEILPQIEALMKKKTLSERLKQAKKTYQNYHCTSTFASCLEKIENRRN